MQYQCNCGKMRYLALAYALWRPYEYRQQQEPQYGPAGGRSVSGRCIAAHHHLAGRAGGPAAIQQPHSIDSARQHLPTRTGPVHPACGVDHEPHGPPRRLCAGGVAWRYLRRDCGARHCAQQLRHLLHRHGTGRFLCRLRAELPFCRHRLGAQQRTSQGHFTRDDWWLVCRHHRPASRDLDPRCPARYTVCWQLL